MCDIDNPIAEQLMQRLAADHSEGLPRVRRYCESAILRMLEEGKSEEAIYQQMAQRIKGLPAARTL
ncbi:MAG TPA: hypothetical protein VNI02_04995 [Blastocatellia bacterium]|jgi:5'-3' exonuclease|nr:hypothetical protein [Blastocatellia bacterium]